MTGARRAGLTTLLLALAAAGALAAPARGAEPPTVEIGASGFKPAVITVAPRTTVTWRNTGSAPRSIVGESWRSPAIAPGAEFKRRFDHVGQYPYRDADDATVTGTVIVALAGTRPRAMRDTARRLFRATVALEVRERWTFRDGHWRSRTGACNGQVGDGRRYVRWTARFPRVEYARAAGVEVLDGGSDRPTTRLGAYTESQDAKVSTSETALVACPDGQTSDRAPTQDASCRRTLSGRRVPMQLLWSRTLGLWQISARGNPAAPEQCGPSYLNSSGLVGLDPLKLPIGLTGNRILFTMVQARATPGEVARLRAGRSVSVTRAFRLRYTTDCCTGWNPGAGGIYARVGAIQEARAKLTITLAPRR